MEIIEVWTCIGLQMHQVSHMFTDVKKANAYILEKLHEPLTPENKDVEYWVRVWKEENGEMLIAENYQLW